MDFPHHLHSIQVGFGLRVCGCGVVGWFWGADLLVIYHDHGHDSDVDHNDDDGNDDHDDDDDDDDDDYQAI